MTIEAIQVYDGDGEAHLSVADRVYTNLDELSSLPLVGIPHINHIRLFKTFLSKAIVAAMNYRSNTGSASVLAHDLHALNSFVMEHHEILFTRDNGKKARALLDWAYTVLIRARDKTQDPHWRPW